MSSSMQEALINAGVQGALPEKRFLGTSGLVKIGLGLGAVALLGMVWRQRTRTASAHY